MPDFQAMRDSPVFQQAVFMFAVLLLLGAWKFGTEGILE